MEQGTSLNGLAGPGAWPQIQRQEKDRKATRESVSSPSTLRFSLVTDTHDRESLRGEGVGI